MRRVIEIPEDKYDALVNDFVNERLTIEEAIQYLKEEFGHLYEEKKSCLDGRRCRIGKIEDNIGPIAKINNNHLESGISLLIYSDHGAIINEAMERDQEIIKNQKIKIPAILRLKVSLYSSDVVAVDVLVQTVDYTYKPLIIDGVKIRKMFGRKINEMLFLNPGFDEFEIEKMKRKDIITLDAFLSMWKNVEETMASLRSKCDSGFRYSYGPHFINSLILLIKILRQYGDDYATPGQSYDDFKIKLEKIYQIEIIKKCISDDDEYNTWFYNYLNLLAKTDWSGFVDFYARSQELCNAQTLPAIDVAELMTNLMRSQLINHEKKQINAISDVIMQDLQQKYSQNKIRTDLKILSIGNDDFPYYLAMRGIDPNNIDIANEDVALNEFIKNKMNLKNAICWNNIKKCSDVELIEEKYDLVILDIHSFLKMRRTKQSRTPDELLCMSINSIKDSGMLVVINDSCIKYLKIKQILYQCAEIDKIVQTYGEVYYVMATKKQKKHNERMGQYWWIDISKPKYMVKCESDNYLRRFDYLENTIGAENEIYGSPELVKRCLWKEVENRGRYLSESFDDYVDQKAGIVKIDDDWLHSQKWIIKESVQSIKITDQDIVAYEKMLFEQLANMMNWYE